MIMAKLGFCYSYVRSPNGLWGGKLANGSWMGLVGLAQRKEVEVIVCPLSSNYDRFQVMDFTKPVSMSAYTIIYPRPTIQPNLAGFLMPFTKEGDYNEMRFFGRSYRLLSGILLMCGPVLATCEAGSFLLVWCAVAAILVLGTAFSLMTKYFATFVKSDVLRYWILERNFLYSYLWTVRGLLTQPLADLELPTGVSGRIFMTFWMIVVFVVGVIYKSNLVALVIVPKVSVPFDNLKELISQDQISWSFLSGSIINHFFLLAFQENPNSVMGRGWEKRGELFASPRQMPSFVLEKKLAAIEATPVVIQLFSDDFSKTGKCRYAAVTERMIMIQTTFGLKKGSAMQEMMNPIILRLREAGILYKLLEGNAPNASYCSVTPGKEKGPELRILVVKDFLGMFYILFAGWFIAAVTFLFELLGKIVESVAKK